MNGIRTFKASNHFNSINKMLKPRIVAAERYNQRLKSKALNRNYTRNIADLLFVGGDCQEFAPSLLVSSEGNKYLFNCGEGTQRASYTNKVTLVNLENVFITSHQWSRIAGIFGFSLTIQDIGATNLCVHSPTGAETLFESARSFIYYNTGIECKVDTSHSEYSDAAIRVQPIPLVDISNASDPSDKARHMDKKSRRSAKVVAYNCQLPDMLGPLNPERCKELNVPVGRHLSVLKSGQDVTLDDGRIVKSSDVCGPKTPGLNFLVIECPTEDCIASVMTNPTLSQLRRNRVSDGEKQVGVVVHYSPQEVIRDLRYQEWMEGFSEECKHMFAFHNELRRLHLVDCYRFQYLLEKLDENIFPKLHIPNQLTPIIQKQLEDLPGDHLENDSDNTEEPCSVVTTNELDKPDRFINLTSMDRFVFRPRKQSESVEDRVAIDALYREATLDPHFEKFLSELKSSQAKIPKPKNYEPEVVFLGTGSAVPSKLRNTSCILVNFHHLEASVILDCGEDSYGQMFRFYGPDKIGEMLKKLKMIYVSHHHTDHHIGLVELLRQRKRYTDSPVQLLIPPGIDKVLNFHNDNYSDLRGSYNYFCTRKLSSIESLTGRNSPTAVASRSELIDKLEGLLEGIDVIPVKHCINSCAVFMRFKIGEPDLDTFSLAYSGDARPSKEFAKRARGCDLLIHEATLEHRMIEDALAKLHSTSTEAIAVAKEMQAKFTILTHFSARLPKIPLFTEEFDDTIGFAFDNMSLRCPTDFARVPILKPICSLIFKKQLQDSDMKHYKREITRQRKEEIIKRNANGAQ